MAASVGDWIGDASVPSASRGARPRRADRGDRDRLHPGGGARLAAGQPRDGLLRRQPRLLGDRLRLAADHVRAELVEHRQRERRRARARHARDGAARAARHAHRHEQHGLERRALRRHRPARRVGAARSPSRSPTPRSRSGRRATRSSAPPTGCVGTPTGDGALAVGYALIAIEIAVVALYGHGTVVALQKIVVPVVGVLLLLGIPAFAGGFDAGHAGGDYVLGGFWSDVDARRHRRGRRPALLRPQPRRLHPPHLAPAPRRPPRAAGRGRRHLPRSARHHAVRRVHRGHVHRPRRLLRRRPRRRRARLVRAADPRDRARGRRRAGRAQPLRQRPRPRGARPTAAARPHDADHVGRRRRPALRRHLRARRGELDHRDDAGPQRPRRAVGRRQPRRLPRRAPRALRPRRPPGLQPGPPRRALLVHRRLEPARAARVGGRLGLRTARGPDRALHRPAREPRRRRRPQPPRLRPDRRRRLPRHTGRLAERCPTPTHRLEGALA